MPQSPNYEDENRIEPTDADSVHKRNPDHSPISDLHAALTLLSLSTNGDESGTSSIGKESVGETGEDYGTYDEEDGYDILRYHFTKQDRALFDQRKEEEVNGSDQRHLEALSTAFRSIPTSEFALGGIISDSQVDTTKLVLLVRKKGSPRQATPKKLTPVKKPKKNKKGKTKRMESDESNGDEDETPVIPTGDTDKGLEFTFPFSPHSFKELFPFTNVSPFGQGKKTVIDDTYRLAREIKPDGFEIRPDPVERSGILTQIGSRLGLGCNLRAEIAKLNIYNKGGFFKSHCDTPRSSDHIGTVVVGLPSDFRGGALSVKHADQEVRFDWGEEWSKYKTATTQLHWAFLYGDCEHQVEEVTFGSRLTLAYDIYTLLGPKNKARPADSKCDELASTLKAALQDRAGFATNGCTLAFGLGHSYPKTTDVGSDVGVEGAFWRHFEHRLKGTDAVLLQAVKQCKLDFTFKAAFFRNMDSFDDPDDEVRIFAELRSLISDRLRGLDQATFTSLYDQLEEQLSTLRVRNGLRKYQVMLVDNPDQMEGGWDNDFGDLEGPTPMDRLHVETRKCPKNLVWVDYPTNYGFQNDYEFAGNDAGDGVVIYSGVALLVHIPAADRR